MALVYAYGSGGAAGDGFNNSGFNQGADGTTNDGDGDAANGSEPDLTYEQKKRIWTINEDFGNAASRLRSLESKIAGLKNAYFSGYRYGDEIKSLNKEVKNLKWQLEEYHRNRQEIDRTIGERVRYNPSTVYDQKMAKEIAENRTLMADLTVMSLDLAGIIDPTPVSDGSSAGISLWRGHYFDAGLSAISLIPYVGDLAKVKKISTWAKTVTKVIAKAAKDKAFAKVVSPALKKIHTAVNSILGNSLIRNNLSDDAVRLLESMKKKLDNFFAPNTGGWIDGMADISKLAKGRKGGAILDGKWREQLVAQLKSLDPNLKLRVDDDLLEWKGFLGGFQPRSGTVILRSDATLFEAVHELGHAKYFADIGSDAAKYLDDVGAAARELEAWRYVLNYAERFPGRFTADELAKARSMFNEEFYKIFGVLPK